MVSDGVDSFLKYLRETEQMYKMACDNEQEANNETQDILHSIELEEHTYNEMARLARKLREIRQRRRIAKDLITQASPVCEWAENNRQIVKGLEQLLGAVRKEEKRADGRTYTPRTQAAKV